MEKEKPFFPLNVLDAVPQRQEHLLEILHDDIIQIGCQIERSLRDLTQSMPYYSPWHGTLDEATVLTTTLLSRLRAVVTNLYTAADDTDDLFAALRILLQDIQERTGLCCLLMTDSLQWSMGHYLQNRLYGIVRELIHNSVTHAHAEWVRVTICREEAMLYVCVQDNGCGFVRQPVDQLCEQGHFGLYLLEQRVGQLDGIVHLCSAPAQGTTVTIRVPLGLQAEMHVPMD